MSVVKYSNFLNGLTEVNDVVDQHLMNQPQTVCCVLCKRVLKIINQKFKETNFFKNYGWPAHYR